MKMLQLSLIFWVAVVTTASASSQGIEFPGRIIKHTLILGNRRPPDYRNTFTVQGGGFGGPIVRSAQRRHST
jgi:hypothetical protein